VVTAEVGPASIVRGDAEPGARLTGRFDLLHEFRSAALGTTRRVSVYLPPGYDDSAARYPALYLQDGQNLFDPGRAFVPGQDWGLDETAEALIAGGEIAPVILVGIDHGGADRIDEYTPSRDPRRRVGGRLPAYRRMLVDELKPWIDARYRTRPEAAATGIGGSSLGGLAALELAMTRRTCSDAWRRCRPRCGGTSVGFSIGRSISTAICRSRSGSMPAPTRARASSIMRGC